MHDTKSAASDPAGMNRRNMLTDVVHLGSSFGAEPADTAPPPTTFRQAENLIRNAPPQ